MKMIIHMGRGAKRTMACAVFGFMLHTGAFAANGDVPGQVSLADQVVAQARQLEQTQVSKAIDMMIAREQEVSESASNREMARFYNKLAELHSTLGKVEQVRLYGNKGLALIGDETVSIGAELHFNLGLADEIQSRYIEARKHYEKGLHIAELTNNRLSQARGKLYLAAVYTAGEDYNKSLELMRNAYSLSEEVKDPELTWEVMNEMGLLYSYLDDEEQAAGFHTKAIEVAKQLQMKELIIVSLYNAALTNIQLKRYDVANVLFGEMLEQSKGSTEKSNMYTAYKGFAISAREAGQYERGFNYLAKAEEYLPYVQHVMQRFEHHMIKAQLLNALEQTNKALEELAIAERLLPEEMHGSSSIHGLGIYRAKSRFFAELNQYEQAYQWLEKFTKGFVEYRDKEREDKALKLRMSFDSERNEVRNQMLEKENEIKALQLKQADSERQIQTFFLVALALLSLVLIFVMYRQFHARRQLKNYAETDSLTELFNRRYAFTNGETLVKQCKQTERAFSIFLFDLDHFKSINDTYGHPAGDLVLKAVADISKSCLRGTDVLARIGGEEFVAILPGVDLDMAEFIATRLRERLESSEQEFQGARFSVTASFGVACLRQGEDFELLTQRADKALYMAKDNGRNCVALAS